MYRNSAVGASAAPSAGSAAAASSSTAVVPLAASSAELQRQTKPIIAAAALIERELDHDEKRPNSLDNLTTSDNGLYQFDAILDQYDALECKSFVGLFPEIARAFITIDNKLFLWNYFDGSDFLLYDELSQIIISVALSRPRAGVFVSAIQWVLTVSTPVEILVFALKFDEGNIHSPLQLFPTQFTIPSDHVHMTNIVGTEQGRILLAGKDGGIYELEYGNGAADEAAQAAAGAGSWFGAGGSGGFASLWSAQSRKKCRKVNHSAPRFRLLRSFLPGWLGGLPLVGSEAGVTEQQVSCMVYDRTRNLLYTLASTASGAGRGTRSILSVFDLGSDGWRMTQRSKNEQIASEVREKLRSLPPSQWEDLAPSTLPNGNTVTPDIALVALFPIPRHESAVVVLMGVTAHGHRVFFDMGETGRGNLHVKFVRLCPPACSPDELNRGALAGGAGARASSQKIEPRYSKSTSPSLVHAAYYKDGILLLADAGRSALGDTLVAVQREAHAAAATARSWGGAASSIAGPQKLLESLDAFDLESRIAELGEVHESSQLNLLSSALYSRSVSSAAASAGFAARPLQGLSELATQHVTPNRHFLILTSTALLTLAATRPIDELRHALLVLKKTNDEGPLVALFHKYGAKEAGAMCLTLIGAHFVSGEMPGAGALDQVEQRSQGGQSLSITSPNKMMGSGIGAGQIGLGGSGGALTATGALSDDALRKLAKQAFFRIADLQLQSELSGAAGIGSMRGSSSSSSSKLESIALYMSRWLRGHWDYSLCMAAAPGSPYLTFRFSREYYVQMLQPLLKLQRFLHENQRLLFRDMSQLTSNNQQSALAQAQAQSGLADPGRLEAENFAALSVLLNITIEIFNLLILFLSYSDTNAIAAANGSQAAANAGSAAAIAGAQSAGASMLLHSSPFLSSGDLQRLRDSSLIDVLMGSEHGLISKLINTLAQVGAASNRSAAAGSGFSPRGKRNRRGDMDDFDGDFGSSSAGVASGSSLIAQLHSACPTFFGESELLYYQALESLARARACWNMESERQAHLNRALSTLSSFLHAPAFPLEEVAAKLKLLHQYEGIVQLALDRAQLLEQREVVRPQMLSAASSTTGHGFGTSASASSSSGLGQGQQSDAEFYRAQKQRCVIVLLDTLNMLIFGVGAATKNLANAAQGAMNIDAGASSSGSASQALTPFSGNSARFDSDVTAVPPLSADALAATRDRVLAQLLSSPDRELHAALYRWYIDKNLLSELYSIHNDAVVEFLMSSEEYRGLLKDYYLRNERWLEAAKLLEFLASTDNDVYVMNQRIEFLTRALLCARNYQNQITQQSAAANSSMMANGRGGAAGRRGASALSSSAQEVSQLQDLIEQLKDRIEIAKIQADIFQKLQTMLQESYSDSALSRLESRPGVTAAEIAAFSSKKESLQQSLGRLDSKLVDIQLLYTLSAEFGLWESCLSIFAFSGERGRGDVIEALWKNILRSLMSSSKRAGADWGEVVRAKVVDLAASPSTLYRDDEFLFPLVFLLREMEINNLMYRRRPEEEWVAATMMEAGVPAARLLAAYDHILDGWEQYAADAGIASSNGAGQNIQTFLFYSIYHVLRRTMEAPEGGFGRRAGVGAGASGAASAAQLFNKCMTSLRTLPPSEDTNMLNKRFQALYQQFNARTR